MSAFYWDLRIPILGDFRHSGRFGQNRPAFEPFLVDFSKITKLNYRGRISLLNILMDRDTTLQHQTETIEKW